jgi:CheY-like chemotaxis protein
MLGTIVLAEDSKTVRRMVEIALHGQPCQLQVAETPDQAVAAAPGAALALVDNQLGGNGYDVARQLKQAGVKVLLLGGTHQQLDPLQVSQSGADGHLVKPFETQALLDAVYTAITGQRAPDSDVFRAPSMSIPLARKDAAKPAAPAVPPAPKPAPPAAPPAAPAAPAAGKGTWAPPPPVATPQHATEAKAGNPFAGVQSPFDRDEATRPFMKRRNLEEGGFGADGATSADARVPEPAESPVAAPAAAPPPAAPAAAPAAAPVAAAVAKAGAATAASLEDALGSASSEVIERVVWEVVPALAEAILKEEIARVVRERLAAQ